MIVIGITGSLSAGKSEAAKILQKKGAKVFDADTAAREAIKKGSPAHRAIVKIFGMGILKKDGEIDRKKIAAHVFSHPKDLKKLIILTHPGVIFDCIKMIELNKKKTGILVLNVPLLFESKMECLADYTVVVTAEKKKILHRARKKGMPEDLAKKILSTQWPTKRKEKLADFVIENNGTIKELEKKILEVVEKIKKAANKRFVVN